MVREGWLSTVRGHRLSLHERRPGSPEGGQLRFHSGLFCPLCRVNLGRFLPPPWAQCHDLQLVQLCALLVWVIWSWLGSVIVEG